MDVTRITVEHVRVAADQPFEKVTKAFEEQIGRFDPGAYQQLNAGADPGEVRAKIKAMEGPSRFMLFRTSDHGALRRLAGQQKESRSSTWSEIPCRPRNDPARHSRSLYAPLRVVIYGTNKARRAWNTTGLRRSSASSGTPR